MGERKCVLTQHAPRPENKLAKFAHHSQNLAMTQHKEVVLHHTFSLSPLIISLSLCPKALTRPLSLTAIMCETA